MLASNVHSHQAHINRYDPRSMAAPAFKLVTSVQEMRKQTIPTEQHALS